MLRAPGMTQKPIRSKVSSEHFRFSKLKQKFNFEIKWVVSMENFQQPMRIKQSVANFAIKESKQRTLFIRSGLAWTGLPVPLKSVFPDFELIFSLDKVCNCNRRLAIK